MNDHKVEMVKLVSSRRPAVVASLVLGVVLAAGCNQVQEPPEAIGRITLAITSVPVDVSCLRITAKSTALTTVQVINVTPGANSVLANVGGLPLGMVTISGEAFSTCPPTTSSLPTWLSDPVAVTIVSGVVGEIGLQMRQAGRGNISVDFVMCSSAGQACSASQTCCASLICTGGACATCGANGAACANSSGCCSGICSNGVCSATTCGSAGQACGGNQTCCPAFVCTGGVCAVPTCGANGAACANSSGCCSGICSNGVCSATTCSSAGQACGGSQTCGANGAACTNSASCCSGICSNGVCSATTCGSAGQACGGNQTCCPAFVCTGGVCAVPTCGANGAACANNAGCCSGVCFNFTCSGSACSSAGQACGGSQTCCPSLVCTGGACAVPTCGANGAACANSASCCSGICSNGVCSASTCGAIGQACTSNATCCTGLTCGGGVCGGTSVIVQVSADAFVRDGTANQGLNFGADPALPIKNVAAAGNNRMAYLRFPLAGLSGSVVSAKLRLFGSRPTTLTVPDGAFAVSDNTWGEGTITWLNKPALGAQQGAGVVPSATAQYHEWDVTAFVSAQRNASAPAVSLAVKMETAVDNANSPDTFNARESAGNRPQLVVITTP